MVVPVAIQDYTDFFSFMHLPDNSRAASCGSPNKILPNRFVDTKCVAIKPFEVSFLFKF